MYKRQDVGLIRECLVKMRDHMKENKVKSMNCPQIGCGIGGWEWSEVKPVIEEVFGSDDDVVLQVVTRTTFD